MIAQEVIARYIQDAEAAERNFEDALTTFGTAGDQNATKSFFQWASEKAKTQHQRLENRLRELGGSPSTSKSLLAHILSFSTTAAQIGHEPAEKNTQHLIMCVGAAAAEMAMYESLAASAAAAGDTVTEQLARQLQAEEKDDYEKAWALLGPSALNAFEKVTARATNA
jgi:ferritin-like metal-binding protein YciE